MTGVRRPSFRAGLVTVLLIAVGTYFAFSKEVPFQQHYELKAVFTSAVNVKQRQPVRIAGVDVGKVVDIDHPQKGEERAIVTMRIEDSAMPVHRDAQVKIRPRLFLEGNWFLDLQPGTADQPELGDGDTIPVQQTKTPVQLAQLLTTLQSDVRRNAQTLFREYASALRGPGADGFRRSIPYWEEAYRSGAIVQEASLGQEPRDLSTYIDSAGRVARGLDRRPAKLKSLITDFNTAARAFARQSGNLEAAIAELPRTLGAARPALARLNEAFPPLRRFTADLRPAIRASGPAIEESFPFLRQARQLVSKRELRGLVRDLVPTVPALVRLSEATPALFEQVRLAAGCENTVLHPWANDRIEDPNFPPSGRVFEEAPKGLPGLAGESRPGDANGQWVRVLTSAGDRTVSLGNGRFAQAYLPILGTNPPKPEGRPPLRPDVPCETQEPPDLRTRPGPGHPTVAQGPPRGEAAARRYARAKRRALRWLRGQVKREGLARKVRISAEELTRTELLGGGR